MKHFQTFILIAAALICIFFIYFKLMRIIPILFVGVSVIAVVLIRMYLKKKLKKYETD